MQGLVDEKRAHPMSYVVAFNRDRDSYQVPLALYERGLLRKLITDIYYPDAGLLRSLPGMSLMKHRRVQGLPSQMTQSIATTVIFQMLLKVNARSAHSVFSSINTLLSTAALREAQTSGSNLFLYSLYASEAFSSPSARNLIKGLFVFHPHGKSLGKF